MKNPLLGLLFAVPLCLSNASADTKLISATITEVRNEAKLYTFEGGPEASVRPAKVNDVVKGDRALRTGKASRAELEFQDKSLVRLGSSTVFSFKPHARLLKLDKGTILYQQPKGRGHHADRHRLGDLRDYGHHGAHPAPDFALAPNIRFTSFSREA